MKILLLVPLLDRRLQWGRFRRGAGNNSFSYGLASIGAYLEREGYKVEGCDPQFFEDGDADLRRMLAAGNYDLVGITCYTPT